MPASPTNGHANRASRRHPEKTTPTPLARRWISVLETAEYLSLSERTVRQMISDGRLVAYRNGHKVVRLDRNEIDAAFTPFGGSVTA